MKYLIEYPESFVSYVDIRQNIGMGDFQSLKAQCVHVFKLKK